MVGQPASADGADTRSLLNAAVYNRGQRGVTMIEMTQINGLNMTVAAKHSRPVLLHDSQRAKAQW